jgi:hypothetical protein
LHFLKSASSQEEEQKRRGVNEAINRRRLNMSLVFQLVVGDAQVLLLQMPCKASEKNHIASSLVKLVVVDVVADAVQGLRRITLPAVW